MTRYYLRNIDQRWQDNYLVAMFALQEITNIKRGGFYEFKKPISMGDCSPIDIVGIYVFDDHVQIKVGAKEDVYAPFYLEDLSVVVIKKIIDRITEEVAVHL